VPGRVHVGMLYLQPWCLLLAPLPCAIQHRLQNRYSLHLQLLSLVCSSPPVAMSLRPSSHGYGGCSGFMAMSYLCNLAHVCLLCSCELSYKVYVCSTYYKISCVCCLLGQCRYSDLCGFGNSWAVLCAYPIKYSSWVAKYLRLVPLRLDLERVLVFLKWNSACPVAGNFIFVREMSMPKYLAFTVA
jgi:hypothetical protein